MLLQFYVENQKNLKKLFKNSFQASFCPETPLPDFSQKNYEKQFQAFMLL